MNPGAEEGALPGVDASTSPLAASNSTSVIGDRANPRRAGGQPADMI